MNKSKGEIIIAIIVIIIIICAGCGFYFYNKEKTISNLLSTAITDMNNKNYKEALNECNTILNKNPNNTQAKEIKNIITNYEKAQTDYTNKDYVGANTALSNISNDYTKYGIAEEINKLKDEVKNSELHQNEDGQKDIDAQNKEQQKGMDNKNKQKDINTKNNANSNEKKVSSNKENLADKNVNSKRKNITSTSTTLKNNGQKSNLKQKYLSELNKMSAKLDNAVTGQTQIEMDIQSGEVYEQWNNKLNEIWGVLRGKLPASEMKELTSKEVNWIKEKDQKIKEVQKQYQGGSILPLEDNMESAELTKDRCYYLVNNYM